MASSLSSYQQTPNKASVGWKCK